MLSGVVYHTLSQTAVRMARKLCPTFDQDIRYSCKFVPTLCVHDTAEELSITWSLNNPLEKVGRTPISPTKLLPGIQAIRLIEPRTAFKMRTILLSAL